MKKWIWIGVVAVVVIFFYATYNGFVNKEEGLKTAWSNEIRAVKTDEHGNWTERMVYVDGQPIFKEIQTIVYY